MKKDEIVVEKQINTNDMIQSSSTKFLAQGTVSASGIVVDTSNKIVKQIFNTTSAQVINEIEVYTNTKRNTNVIVRVGGTYQPSSLSTNRVLVAFNLAQIIIQFTLLKSMVVCINFGWIFTIIAKLFNKGNRNNGWLETTYIDTSLRIGRGNKGTLFILTR
jgi:hypothetical protein